MARTAEITFKEFRRRYNTPDPAAVLPLFRIQVNYMLFPVLGQ